MKLKISFVALLTSFLSVSQSVSNINALYSYTGGSSVYIEGYYTPGDGGGGHFYKTASSELDDRGTIFTSSSQGYIWKRIINDGNLNVKWFGAKGDGITNDGVAVAKATSYLSTHKYKLYFPSGVYNFGNGFVQIDNSLDILGDGQSSILVGENSTGKLMSINSDNVTVANLSFKTTGGGYGHGILVGTTTIIVKNIVLQNLYFDGPFANTISIFESNDIKILDCKFENVKYQIIQAWGFPSNNVLVNGNYSINCLNDFVELNSEKHKFGNTSAIVNSSKNWVITNNIVRNVGQVSTTNDDMREKRFIGVTNTDGIIISNNIFDTCYGDSAFHFEGLTGNVVISNNTIKNPNSTFSDTLAGTLIYNISENSSPTKDKERVIIFENNIVELESNYTTVCKRLFYSGGEDNTSFQILNNKFYNNSNQKDINVIFKALSRKLWNIKNNEFHNFNKVIEVAQESSLTNIIDNSFYNCDSSIIITDASTYNNSIRIEGNLFKNIVKVLQSTNNSKINLLSFQGNVIDNSNLKFDLNNDFLNGFKNNTFLNNSTTTYNDKSIKLNIVNGAKTIIFDYKNVDYTYLCWVDIVSTNVTANRAKYLLRVSRNMINSSLFNNYVQVIDQTRSGNWPLPIFTVDQNGLLANITGANSSNFNIKVNIIDINGNLMNNEQALGYSPTIVSTSIAQNIESSTKNNFENSVTYEEFLNAYPNPVKDILIFETDSKIDSIQIYDLNGKLIKEIYDAKKMTEINLIDLPTGLYIGIFQTMNNKIIKKIVKE